MMAEMPACKASGRQIRGRSVDEARHVVSTCRKANPSGTLSRVDALTAVPRGSFAFCERRGSQEGEAMRRSTLSRISVRFPAVPFAAALIAVAWLHPVPPAHAQAEPQTSGAGSSAQSENIPDQKLDAAAAAIERMANIKQDYQLR